MRRSIPLCLALGAFLFPAGASTQTRPDGLLPIEGPDAPEPGLEGGDVGYEVSLVSPPSLRRGHGEVFAGVAYEASSGLDLRATAGLTTEVLLVGRTPTPPDVDAEPYHVVARARATSGAAGAFSVTLDVPDVALVAPLVVVRVGRPGAPARRWVQPVQLTRDRFATLLTDRLLYEGGETIHVWALLRSIESERPIPGVPLRLELRAGDDVLSETAVRSGESGAIVADLPIAPGLGVGSYEVRLLDADVPLASRTIQVGTRHLERMRVAVGLDRRLVGPGEDVTGLVSVVAADSTPVALADVEITVEGVVTAVSTDARGEARFSIAAPSYLSGDSRTLSLDVVARHAAHGSAVTSAGFTVTRVGWFVSLEPEAGGLVVDAEQEVYVAVTDALNDEAPAGLVVAVSGSAVIGGTQRITTDAHGLGRIRVRATRTASARSIGGSCVEAFATELVATVEDGARAPREARLCVAVAEDVAVAPRLSEVVVPPGGRVEVRLLRAPGSRTPVLVELSDDEGRAYVATILPASQDRVTLDVPASASGWLQVWTSPVSSDGARNAVDRVGATWLGGGARAYLAVRPDDAFTVALSTDRPAYLVRDTANVHLALDVPPLERAWATVLVRDEAWHAGEEDYALWSWTTALRDAIRRPTPAGELALRYAYAAMLDPAEAPSGAPRVIAPPWDPAENDYGPGSGVTYDAIDAREVMLRDTYPAAAQQLEAFLAGLPTYDPESVRGVLQTRGGRVRFGADAFERLVELGLLDAAPIGLGGRPLTPAELEQAGFGFSFDVAAARVARDRLVALLSIVARVGGTSDAALARIFSVEPPERWLGLAVQHGLCSAEMLEDPWGRPFEFRRVSRTPSIVVSERAPDHELASPGPDGRFGTADDVHDPFARVVAAGTLWAERSGENQLIAELSRIAPGPDTLARMMQAYRELGLAAADELVPSAVYAYASEEYDESGELRFGGGGVAEGTIGLGSLGTIGHGAGVGGGSGYGSGYGSGSGSFRSRGPISPIPVVASALARVVREDFPATLFFVGEVPLDARGQADVPVRLADAVTTYRIEAIAWGATGWRASALTRITVDQAIQIDAPIPEVARRGDRLRIPLRAVNRGASPVSLTPRVTVDGEAVSLAAPSPLEVPATDAATTELLVEVRGTGACSITIEALDASGRVLDAVRRPLRAIDDARRVERRLEVLLEAGRVATYEAPPGALSGTGELRLWAARTLFGEPSDAESDVAQAWAESVMRQLGIDVPRSPERSARLVRTLESLVPREDDAYRVSITLPQLAFDVGVGWEEPAISDALMGALLRQLTDRFTAGEVDAATAALVGIGPIVARADRRPALAGELRALADRLRDAAADAGARESDSPAAWVHVAAALALVGNHDDDARIDEMLRRLERHHVVLARAGEPELSWVEGDAEVGTVDSRVMPTAWLALVLFLRHDERGALPLLRALTGMREGWESWPHGARALGGLVLQLGARSPPASELTLRVDGVETAVAVDGRSYALEAIGAPGRHTFEAALTGAGVAFATITSSHLVGWDTPPSEPLGVELSWIGEVGARDTRTGLWLELRNATPRVLTRPVVEIQLPTGAELEPAARALLEARGHVDVLDGSVRVALGPLGVGRRVLLPLRARLSVAGTLRGLGVSVYDARALGERERAAMLPSRELEVATSGPEPLLPELDAVAPPDPVPLPIDPLPIRLGEAALR